jgi:MoaA/NifB/PqqE/SkfB family radical SAM enzyme
MGRKAILNTNGHAMTPEMLRELKDAGLIGLTFHVDSKQGRPVARQDQRR